MQERDVEIERTSLRPDKVRGCVRRPKRSVGLVWSGPCSGIYEWHDQTRPATKSSWADYSVIWTLRHQKKTLFYKTVDFGDQDCVSWSELSMGPFCVTRSDTTHQMNDPTRPDPILTVIGQHCHFATFMISFRYLSERPDVKVNLTAWCNQSHLTVL